MIVQLLLAKPKSNCWIRLGKVKKGHHTYTWWRQSLFAEHTDWYFDESNVIARYEIADSWTSRKIDFSNVVQSKVNTKDFMIPRACL